MLVFKYNYYFRPKVFYKENDKAYFLERFFIFHTSFLREEVWDCVSYALEF